MSDKVLSWLWLPAHTKVEVGQTLTAASLKDIEYYMSLRYPIVLTPLKSEEGGGWFAEIKELPGCAADGDTPEEAIRSIEESKRLWIGTALKEGRHIPLPESEEQAQYSRPCSESRRDKTVQRAIKNDNE